MSLIWAHVLCRLPSCSFIVQDLPEVVETARGYLMQEDPMACQDGRLRVCVQDLFQAQSVKADVFILRHVMYVQLPNVNNMY